MADQNLTPIKLAYVIDNEVVDVLHTDERLAAIFLSQPIIVDITDFDSSGESVVGWSYDGQTFTKPEPEVNS